MKEKTGKTPRAIRQPSEATDPLERMKWEVAEELGLLDKVRSRGWGGLSAAESGRVGGIMKRRLQQSLQTGREP